MASRFRALVATTNRIGLGEGKACRHSSHFAVPIQFSHPFEEAGIVNCSS